MEKLSLSDSEWYEFVSNNSISHMTIDELRAVLPNLENPNNIKEQVFCPMFRKYICDGCCMEFTYFTDYDAERSFCTPQLLEHYQEILDEKGFDYVQDMCGICWEQRSGYKANYQLSDTVDTILRELNSNGDVPVKIKRIKRLSGNSLIKQQRRLTVESGLRSKLGRCVRISKINRRYKKIGNRRMRNLPVDTDKLPNSYHKRVSHNMWRDW
jgi:hypothetical protein